MPWWLIKELPKRHENLSADEAGTKLHED